MTNSVPVSAGWRSSAWPSSLSASVAAATGRARAADPRSRHLLRPPPRRRCRLPSRGLSASCDALPFGRSLCRVRARAGDLPGEIDAAIRTLQNEQPELFDSDNAVLAIGAYYLGLIRDPRPRGPLRALRRGGAGRHQHQRLQRSVRRPDREERDGGSVTSPTAPPAIRPRSRLDRGPLAPPPEGCSLPSSREIACSREEDGRFFGQVESAVNQVMAAAARAVRLRRCRHRQRSADPGPRRVPPGRDRRSDAQGFCSQADGAGGDRHQERERLLRAVRHPVQPTSTSAWGRGSTGRPATRRPSSRVVDEDPIEPGSRLLVHRLQDAARCRSARGRARRARRSGRSATRAIAERLVAVPGPEEAVDLVVPSLERAAVRRTG